LQKALLERVRGYDFCNDTAATRLAKHMDEDDHESLTDHIQRGMTRWPQSSRSEIGRLQTSS
jgi:hypothetical protein